MGLAKGISSCNAKKKELNVKGANAWVNIGSRVRISENVKAALSAPH
jgi:hypothetical protein